MNVTEISLALEIISRLELRAVNNGHEAVSCEQAARQRLHIDTPFYVQQLNLRSTATT